MELQFDFDESREIHDEVIKVEILNDALRHAIDIDPRRGVKSFDINEQLKRYDLQQEEREGE